MDAGDSMVTIKKIAELCGVSRGTVDRVLNERGRVKPETEEVVRQTASFILSAFSVTPLKRKSTATPP